MNNIPVTQIQVFSYNGKAYLNHQDKCRAHIKNILLVHNITVGITEQIADILVHDISSINMSNQVPGYQTLDNKVFLTQLEADQHQIKLIEKLRN